MSILVLKDANILDVLSGKIVNSDVLIENGIISRIGKNISNGSAEKISLNGKL